MQVPQLMTQFISQLAHMVSYNWWKSVPTWTHHHPFTNHNSPHGSVVAQIVPQVMASALIKQKTKQRKRNYMSHKLHRSVQQKEGGDQSLVLWSSGVGKQKKNIKKKEEEATALWRHSCFIVFLFLLSFFSFFFYFLFFLRNHLVLDLEKNGTVRTAKTGHNL